MLRPSVLNRNALLNKLAAVKRTEQIIIIGKSFQRDGSSRDYFRGTSVERGTANSSHDDLMPITCERHCQVAGTAGRPSWLSRVAFRLGLDTYAFRRRYAQSTA